MPWGLGPLVEEKVNYIVGSSALGQPVSPDLTQLILQQAESLKTLTQGLTDLKSQMQGPSSPSATAPEDPLSTPPPQVYIGGPRNSCQKVWRWAHTFPVSLLCFAVEHD